MIKISKNIFEPEILRMIEPPIELFEPDNRFQDFSKSIRARDYTFKGFDRVLLRVFTLTPVIEWYILDEPKEDLFIWNGADFETVLNFVPPEIKNKLLFHLDLFT